MKSLIKLFKPVLIFCARTYWYIFRPKTFGAKVVVTYGDEVLLVKTTYGYKLTLPGGGIKKNEKPEDAAKRELMEEVGIVVNNLKYLGTIVSTAEYKIDNVYVFHAEVENKETNIDNLEIDRVEWQGINNIQGSGSLTLDMINLFKNQKIVS